MLSCADHTYKAISDHPLVLTMDSGNSASLQSSSEEEYDSRRSDTISALLQPSSAQFPPPPPSQQPVFDHFPNFLDAPSMNSFLNFDAAYTSERRPEPSFGGGGPRAEAQRPSAGRNPKKRSRASRRAPTTVLTTDTTNFRAMVQEFTGIPAPPFSAAAFPRTRLDLFNTAAASSLRSGLSNPPQLPPYLLRPFAQKHSFSNSIFAASAPPLTTLMDVVASTATTTVAAAAAPAAAAAATVNSSNPLSINIAPNSTSSSAGNATASNSNSLQLTSCDLGVVKQLPNLQNPIFAFQSQRPKLPISSNSPDMIGARAQMPASFASTSSNLIKARPLGSDGVGSTSNHGSNIESQLINLVAGSDGASLGWGCDGVGAAGYNSSSQRVTSSCKLNYNASGMDFHAEKASENVASRGEGMVDSWICSTD